MDSLESLQRKINSAEELKSVVKTMKAMAASNIGQYESAVRSLRNYFKNIELGFAAYLRSGLPLMAAEVPSGSKPVSSRVIIIFGSDQGLVGQFNEIIAQFLMRDTSSISEHAEIWAVGERVNDQLVESANPPTRLFPVPNAVRTITTLIANILTEMNEVEKAKPNTEFYIYHNRPMAKSGYEPTRQRVLPLDKQWKDQWIDIHWPTQKVPEVFGKEEVVLSALIREYLFVSIYQACAESLASENASRLEAMQRADKNIEDLLTELNSSYHRLRQSTIDEELFDVVSGFEALRRKK